MKKEKKTELIFIRVSAKDRAAMEKAAERNGMTLSEFVRAATLTMMITDLDPHALRMLAAGVSNSAMGMLEALRLRSKQLATG